MTIYPPDNLCSAYWSPEMEGFYNDLEALERASKLDKITISRMVKASRNTTYMGVVTNELIEKVINDGTCTM